MKKVNKILMATVAILLSLVLISTSVVSGVFAKFVIKKTTETTVKLEKFGVSMEVTAPSNVTKVNDGENVSVTLDNVLMTPGYSDYYLIQFKFSGTPTVITHLKVAVDIELSPKFYVPADKFPEYSSYTNKAHMPIRFGSSTILNGVKKDTYKTDQWMTGTGDTAQAAVDNLEQKLEEKFAEAIKSALSAKYYIAEVDSTYPNPIVGPEAEGNGYYSRKTFAKGQPILVRLGGDVLTFGYYWDTTSQSGYKPEFAAYIADSFTASDVPIRLTITVSLEQA